MSYVKDQISSESISKISSLLGESQGVAKTAISAALPTILKGIINRGDTAENVTALNKFIGDNGINANLLNNLDDSYLSKGSKVVDFLFGSAKSTLMGNISNAVGFNSSKTSSLVSALAPMALHYVSKLGKSENYSDAQMATYLDSQKGNLTKVTASSTTSTAATSNAQTTQNSSGRGGGLLKWLIPLLIIGGLIWWLMTKDKSAVDETVDNTEMSSQDDKVDNSTKPMSTTSRDNNANASSGSTTTGGTDNTSTSTTGAITSSGDVKAATDGMTLTMDDMGNLVDADGKIVAKKGEFKEMDGYYVDGEGNKIGLLSKIGGAIAGAASKTADGFKKVFSGLFKGKEKVGSTYLLTDIVFDPKSHKITNFSKNEVEGLAAALKSMPDAKIKVQVHSKDGKDDKESKEFTKLRANVVHDMLVTLGVKDGQISFEGMGNKDATKAAGQKVEIKVEQTVQ